MTLRTYSINPRLASYPTIDPMISKSHWTKALPHLSAPFTPCPRRNLQLSLRKFIDENLATGFIHPSCSSHGAPVLFIQKKDGSLRLCVDFRGPNQISQKDQYPLPLISDLLDTPRKARIYTKINLWQAYHLVQVTPGDKWNTAFQTRYSSFEWLVMPEGLTNAPTAFQQFMNDIFTDMIDVIVIIYLDDILIYSNNLSEH